MQLLDADEQKPDDQKIFKTLYIIIALFSICNPSLIALLNGYNLYKFLLAMLVYNFLFRLGTFFLLALLALIRVLWVTLSDAIGLSQTSNSKLERDQTMMLLYFMIICDSVVLTALLYDYF